MRGAIVVVVFAAASISGCVVMLGVVGVVEIVSIVSAVISAGALGAVVVQIRSDSAYRRAEEEIRKALLRKVFAKMVSAWVEQPDQRRITVQNRADQPIYHVVVRLVLKDADAVTVLRQIPEYVVSPGRYMLEIGEVDVGPRSTFWVDIVFRDVLGNCWWRDCDGVLHELTESSFGFAGVVEPFWTGQYVRVD